MFGGECARGELPVVFFLCFSRKHRPSILDSPRVLCYAHACKTIRTKTPFGVKSFVLPRAAEWRILALAGSGRPAPRLNRAGQTIEPPTWAGNGVTTMMKFVTIAESITPDVYVSLCLKNNGAGEFSVILFNAVEEFEAVVFESNGNNRLAADIEAAADALAERAEEFFTENDYPSYVACNIASQVFAVAFANTVHEQAGGYPTAAAWAYSVERSNAPAWKTLGSWVID